MPAEKTEADNVFEKRTQPYSGWFVLAKFLLWLYHTGCLSLLVIFVTAVVTPAWTDHRFNAPDCVFFLFNASIGLIYGGGCLLFLLAIWMLPRQRNRGRPWRELWLVISLFVPVWGLSRYRELVRISDKGDRRMFQFSLRTMLKLAVLVCLLTSYGTCYYRISRARMAEAAETGLEGFFYVPMDDIVAANDLTARHYLLALFFAPANMVDHFVFGAPEPVTHAPIMRLN